MCARRQLSLCFFTLAVTVSGLITAANCYAAPIYVYKQKDGTTRFSDRPPPEGTEAKVFSPRQVGFSVYKIGPPIRVSRLVSRYHSLIASIADEAAVDAGLIKAIIHAESAFNPWARSAKGAQGLMQLMPQTARELGVSSPYTAEQNIRGGVAHLSRLLRKYPDARHAIAAYNSGERPVDQHHGIPPFEETKEYVARVMSLWQRYRSERP
jgi:soluble lytic murein transglycosylase-like protein